MPLLGLWFWVFCFDVWYLLVTLGWCFDLRFAFCFRLGLLVWLTFGCFEFERFGFDFGVLNCLLFCDLFICCIWCCLVAGCFLVVFLVGCGD